MAQAVRKVDFINIDCDGNFFDVKEQINLRNRFYFLDRYVATKIQGTNTSTGHFSNNQTRKRKSENTNSYQLQDTVIDASGNSRNILSLDIDLFASSSVDSYRNGVEITEDKHWTAGLAKISAGTAGHLYDKLRYGITGTDVLDYLNVPNTSSLDSSGTKRQFLTGDATDGFINDNAGNVRNIFLDGRPSSVYSDSGNFNAAAYLDTGDAKTKKILNHFVVTDGIIEPLTIRSILTNHSTDNPFEPHATRAEFGNGNVDSSNASDVITSIDYFLPTARNNCFFLDATEGTDVVANGNMSSLAYITGSIIVNTGKNLVPPFKEQLNPRGVPTNSTYDGQLTDAINQLKQGGTAYVTNIQKSATCGYSFETEGTGVDSIAYGDTSYGTNRDNRRRKRSITSLRDASSFIKENSGFNDTNTINFSTQAIEYPSMLPTNYAGSIMNDTIRSEVYKSGAIQVSGSLRPNLCDVVLVDSILSAQKRLGVF